MSNRWAREQLRQAMLHGLGLDYKQVDAIADRITTVMDTKRLTLVPTYLGDAMFDAQREVNPELPYTEANKLWTAAIKRYDSYDQPAAEDMEAQFSG